MAKKIKEMSYLQKNKVENEEMSARLSGSAVPTARLLDDGNVEITGKREDGSTWVDVINRKGRSVAPAV